MPFPPLAPSSISLRDAATRRQWLKFGALTGLAGGAFKPAKSARAEAAPATRPRARACILLFLTGGPPQHETWDPKPHAPGEVRGTLGPIATATPGFQIGELLPLTAPLTNHIAALRAVSTMDSAHSSSGYWMLTGRPHAPTNFENSKPGRPNDWPCLAALLRHWTPDAGLPSSVRLPDEIWNDGKIVWPGQDGGWLGRGADPWLLRCDPSSAEFEVADMAPPEQVSDRRFAARELLRTAMDVPRALAAAGGAPMSWDRVTHQAAELIAASSAKRAFDLSSEPDAVRDRYGRNVFGQSVLLARRLVEAGVACVQVNYPRMPNDPAGSPVWDTHADNAGRLKSSLMPTFDRAFSGLLEDLLQRGLLDETVVVVMGEFGRTPRLNPRGGRDHWGPVFSVALAGGGIQGGALHGASDAQGGYPSTGRVQPEDLHATVLHLLGFEPETLIYDAQGRGQPASPGRVIEEIV